MRKAVVLLALAAAGCNVQSNTVGLQDGLQRPAEAPARVNACTSTEGKKLAETSVVEIATVLRGGDFRKSEFEKTDQFKARMAGRVGLAQQKIAKTGQDDLFYFTLPIPPEQISYNADTAFMKIGGEYASLVKTPGIGDGQLVVKETWRPTGQTYVGENSFGVKRQITKVEITELLVTAPSRRGGRLVA